MVNGALSIGGVVGVLLSGAFVYFEIGRFAAPQVPKTRFDERRELFAYTAGLFVGVPLAFLWLLLLQASVNGALVSGVVDVALLAVASELGQWLLTRSVYFGRSEATPFYALGYRAGTSAILILAVIAAFLGGTSVGADGTAQAALQCVALLAIQVNGGLLSVRRSPQTPTARGGPLSGLLVGFVSLAVLALGMALGPLTGAAAGLLIVGGLVPSYRRLRRQVLEPPPELSAPPPGAAEGSAFGRKGSGDRN